MSHRRSGKFRLGCLLVNSALLAVVSLLPGGKAAPIKWDSRITPAEYAEMNAGR